MYWGKCNKLSNCFDTYFKLWGKNCNFEKYFFFLPCKYVLNDLRQGGELNYQERLHLFITPLMKEHSSFLPTLPHLFILNYNPIIYLTDSLELWHLSYSCSVKRIKLEHPPRWGLFTCTVLPSLPLICLNDTDSIINKPHQVTSLNGLSLSKSGFSL